MKLWILSDLHREFPRYRQDVPRPYPDHDVVVLAGDIDNTPSRAIEWAAETFDKPIIYVAGNHEFYGTILKDEIIAGMETAARLGVHYLENRAVEIDGVRFFGCTLWSDFALHGEMTVPIAMAAAKRGLNDFSQIMFERDDVGRSPPELRRSPRMPLRFQPAHARGLHQESRVWLEESLPPAADASGKIVVVTHNAPHKGSVQPQFEGDALSPCFVNHLPEVFQRHHIDLWVHGHCHGTQDYKVGETRVVENSYGYGMEDPAFRWDLVIEV